MKVLIIEDEISIAKNIQKGLQLQKYEVDVAYDGEVGANIAMAGYYDVIVLDVMLPKLDGFQVLKELRQHGNHTPVLMLTAKNQVDDRVEGLDLGADDYLGKPFAFSELVARIKALMRRPKSAVEPILQTDSLSLNPSTFTVIRAGEEVALSKKEFNLLHFLMRHEGQVLTKDQLTEQVWSYESDVLPNTAQVYLGYLRNKIDRAFPSEKALIHTVRGFGYMFGVKE